MELVDAIKRQGLDNVLNKYKLKAVAHKLYPNLVLLKYSQIESPMGEIIVQQARGIILDSADNWNIISYPYDKFFNYGEGHAAQINWETATVSEKLDGCCHEDVILQTQDGLKTIREVCENFYKGKVLGFDIETQQEVWVDVEDHSVGETTYDWYEITLEDGTSVKLTGNHKVWVPKENLYRRVDCLIGEEEFLLC